MKVCFLPCWLDGNSSQAASVRVRCEWVAKYWDDADIYQEGVSLDKYDVLVFQKVFLTERAREIATSYPNKIKIFDLNDPMWIYAKDRLERQLAYMDAATCITTPVAEWLEQRLPTKIIPDRLDMELHTVEKGGRFFSRRVGVLWAGYAQNYELVERVFGNYISERGLHLAILSNAPCGKWPFIQWESAEQECEQMKRFDIILNPRSDEGIWKYKSLQKTHKAWALGLPVAHSVAELRKLLAMMPEEMHIHCDSLRREAEENWDVKKSVEEWRQWIDEVTRLHRCNW